LINATDGITADDIRDMFDRSPQTAADLIRERGHKYYSDRVNNNQVKIV
jgi:arsenate reductase-like glutaredoxin family protein